MTRTAKPDAITLLAALKLPPSTDLAVADIRRPRSQARKPKPGARAGTRLIAGHFPDVTLRALKHLMAEEDATLQALLDEAINDLLVKKGRIKLANT